MESPPPTDKHFLRIWRCQLRGRRVLPCILMEGSLYGCRKTNRAGIPHAQVVSSNTKGAKSIWTTSSVPTPDRKEWDGSKGAFTRATACHDRTNRKTLDSASRKRMPLRDQDLAHEVALVENTSALVPGVPCSHSISTKGSSRQPQGTDPLQVTYYIYMKKIDHNCLTTIYNVLVRA